ncbi:MAG TPA: hypothetical protein VIS53_05590 [Candidatus Udaeobacter sp.]
MFDATHLQNVQPTATVNIAEKSNFKLQSSWEVRSEKLNIQTRECPVGALKILGNWIWDLEFPDESQIPRDWTWSRKLQ